MRIQLLLGSVFVVMCFFMNWASAQSDANVNGSADEEHLVWLTPHNGCQTQLVSVVDASEKTILDVVTPSGGQLSLKKQLPLSRRYERSARWLFGDVTGNGADDVIVIYPGPNRRAIVHVYPSSKEGVATAFATTELGANFWTAQRWLVGDVTGDEKQDLVLIWGRAGEPTRSHIFESLGGKFKATSVRTFLQTTHRPEQKWFLGDVTGKDTAELVLVHKEEEAHGPGPAVVDVFRTNFDLGETASGFAKTPVRTGLNANYWKGQQWLLEDSNKDGKDDLFLTYNASGITRVWQFWSRPEASDIADFFETVPRKAGDLSAYNRDDRWVVGDFEGNGTTVLASVAEAFGDILLPLSQEASEQCQPPQTEDLRAPYSVEDASDASPWINNLPSGSTRLQSVDLNVDGVDDIVTTSSRRIYIPGRFGSVEIVELRIYLQAKPIVFTVETEFREVATGDVNNDGLVDIVMTGKDVFSNLEDGSLVNVVTEESDSIIVFYQTGLGTFEPVHIPMNFLPDDYHSQHIALADLDQDGRQDIFLAFGKSFIVPAKSWFDVQILFQREHETFQPGQTHDNFFALLEGGLSKVRIADLNRDNLPDVVVQVSGFRETATAEFLVRFQNGNSESTVFEEQKPYGIGGPSSAADFDIGDINSDGYPEVVVAVANITEYPYLHAGRPGCPNRIISLSSRITRGWLAIFQWVETDAELQPVQVTPFPFWNPEIRIADLDGDGGDDLFIYPVSAEFPACGYFPYRLPVTNISTMFQRENGTLGPLTTFSPQGNSWGKGGADLAVGDFTGDGIADIVIQKRWGGIRFFKGAQ